MKFSLKWGKLAASGFLLLYLWHALFSLVFRVHTVSAAEYWQGQVQDVPAQLDYLKQALHAENLDIARVMLTHTFYGYSLANLTLQNSHDKASRAQTIEELEFVLSKLDLLAYGLPAPVGEIDLFFGWIYKSPVVFEVF